MVHRPRFTRHVSRTIPRNLPLRRTVLQLPFRLSFHSPTSMPDYDLQKLDDYRWQIPQTDGMRVPARLYATEEMLEDILEDDAPQQAANVAHMPGIVGASMAMPDIHWGYGFPIGGVAAFDPDDGVISPGGVGYDVNCLSGDSPWLHAVDRGDGDDVARRDAALPRPRRAVPGRHVRGGLPEASS